MELYTDTAYRLSRQLTLRYSTSFGKSTQLFAKNIQPHIFAIYGLVRIADEIVDTYQGAQVANLLDELEVETYRAIKLQFSSNPIVHAFALTAKKFGITKTLIQPFFESMRLDLKPHQYTQKLYETYIYGSAEVIGLMCVKVFVNGDTAQYNSLKPGARALGAAYQKVNFLRDIASDFHDRQRVYFPGITFDSFGDTDKEMIIKDIEKDFRNAKSAIDQLPASAKKAVKVSYLYYNELLKKLSSTPAANLKTTRIRVSNSKKVSLLITQTLSPKGGR